MPDEGIKAAVDLVQVAIGIKVNQTVRPVPAHLWVPEGQVPMALELDYIMSRTLNRRWFHWYWHYPPFICGVMT